MNKIKYSAALFLILSINFDIFSDSFEMSIYQQNAIKYDSSYFHTDDDFTILGSIIINGQKIIFAYNVYVWGSSLRATCRLLLFKEGGVFIGMYSGINEDPEMIKPESKKILFSLSPKYGNVIDFSNGIPRSIWINGEVHEYTEIIPLRNSRR